jgi:hypothetical protein
LNVVGVKKMETLFLECGYNWQQALLREKVGYIFPMAISPYMRINYKGPAVFRWEVYQKEAGDKKIVYIGEAQELCPKRLYGYLNPGPTQAANKKVNLDFRGYLKEKMNIRLDICDIQEFNLGGSALAPGFLEDKYIRRMLVAAQIIEHKKKGYTVVDL